MNESNINPQVVHTLHTPGWPIIENLMEASATQLINTALDENDPQVSENLMQMAKGARRFLVQLRKELSVYRAVSDRIITSDDFAEVAMQ